MAIFIPKKLSLEELPQEQKKFLALKPPSETYDAWKELHAFFSERTITADRELWLSYFRWYTELTWRMITRMERDVVSDFAIKRQIVMAILVGFDPVQQITQFLAFVCTDEDDVKKTFKSFKNNFFASSAVFGLENGVNVTVSQMLIEIKNAHQMSDDSIKMAELKTRVHNLFAQNLTEESGEYFINDVDELVAMFFSITNFFLAGDEEKIYPYVDAYLNAEKYDLLPEPTEEEIQGILEENKKEKRQMLAEDTQNDVAPENISESESSTSLSKPVQEVPSEDVVSAQVASSKQTDSTAADETQSVSAAISEAEKVSQDRNVSTDTQIVPQEVSELSQDQKPSPKEIRLHAAMLFQETDENGQVKDLEGLLEFLEGLADHYNDPSIADLYFFDDESEKFIWDESTV